ncbi:hypothetical protein RhiirA5_420843 [Rhizophagus irregularis]|uniref:Uncharacterized protein n=1 Tax=Rhizophagus irregularis TaxID=588596 RepID=A0A2I1EYM5_9GLOM|nr:hypothetical protein RhiirA5_420843 [Rhizophagus irregularis]PKC70057.1 hypothetical protein RhiirA1_455238 [Rhizophagus irregularis]PKY27224.1 hypothetical protein RhiirB3_442845 [Rhizophagus irregularis]
MIEEASGIRLEVEELLNRGLVLFEQSFPEREKDITDHENLLHQHEKKICGEIGTSKIRNSENNNQSSFLVLNLKRLQDEHKKFVDDLRSLKKKLEDQYNNKM